MRHVFRLCASAQVDDPQAWDRERTCQVRLVLLYVSIPSLGVSFGGVSQPVSQALLIGAFPKAGAFDEAAERLEANLYRSICEWKCSDMYSATCTYICIICTLAQGSSD